MAAAHEPGAPGGPVPPHAPHPHHTADPAALEDPVHHDVAEHELEHELEEEEASDDDEDDPGAVRAEAAVGAGAREVSRGAGTGRTEGGPSGWPDPAEPTGDEPVDAAVRRLREVPDLPVSEHVAVYEDVHRRLQDALADLDGS